MKRSSEEAHVSLLAVSGAVVHRLANAALVCDHLVTDQALLFGHLCRSMFDVLGIITLTLAHLKKSQSG